MNSNLATLIRTVVIVTIRSEWKLTKEISKKGLTFLILSGLATGASWLCYYRALQMEAASKVAPLDKLSVTLTIVLAAIFLKETLDLKTIIGGLLIVSGSMVLVL